jgi:hypothetical protein
VEPEASRSSTFLSFLEEYFLYILHTADEILTSTSILAQISRGDHLFFYPINSSHWGRQRPSLPETSFQLRHHSSELAL